MRDPHHRNRGTVAEAQARSTDGRAVRLKRVLALGLAIAMLGVVGCQLRQRPVSGSRAQTSAAAATRMQSPDDGDAESDPTTMPVLVGKRLSQAYAVSAMSDFNVWVQFPAIEATWTARPRGGGGKSVVRSAILPQIVKTLTEVRLAGNRVVSQRPLPGQPVSADTTITLVADAHPGSGPDGWGSGHMAAAAKGGAQQCVGSCHLARECADCHERYQ
jgi:hypothetical protein